MMQSCENCMYRLALQCRKLPPVRLPRTFTNDATAGNRIRNEQLIWGWPAIEMRDWCGEWRSNHEGKRTV